MSSESRTLADADAGAAVLSQDSQKMREKSNLGLCNSKVQGSPTVPECKQEIE